MSPRRGWTSRLGRAWRERAKHLAERGWPSSPFPLRLSRPVPWAHGGRAGRGGGAREVGRGRGGAETTDGGAADGGAVPLRVGLRNRGRGTADGSAAGRCARASVPRAGLAGAVPRGRRHEPSGGGTTRGPWRTDPRSVETRERR